MIRRSVRGRFAFFLGGAVAVAAVAGCRLGSVKPIAVDPVKAYIDAKAELGQAAEDEDPFTRSHAMEALAQTLGAKAGGRFKQALNDEDPSVRFAAAMAIGDARYAPAKADLVRMAKLAGPDKRVYCAVIYALHNLGDANYTGDLARLLTEHREPQVRSNAAMVMGKLGEPSAVGPMKMMLENEQSNLVKVNLVEALAMLGDLRHGRMLEAYTKGYDVGIRLVAIRSLGRSGSAQAVRVLLELLDRRNPAPVRIVAAAELGKLKQADAQAYDLCVRAAKDPQAVIRESSTDWGFAVGQVEVHSVQHLAAIALGWMRRREAVNVLHPLLRSPHGQVRVAAAMSIIRILKETAPREKPEAKGAGALEPSSRPAKPEKKLHTAGGRD